MVVFKDEWICRPIAFGLGVQGVFLNACEVEHINICPQRMRGYHIFLKMFYESISHNYYDNRDNNAIMMHHQRIISIWLQFGKRYLILP
jgi:hypothetical protein